MKNTVVPPESIPDPPSEVAVKREERPALLRPCCSIFMFRFMGGDSSNTANSFKAPSLDTSARLKLAGWRCHEKITGAPLGWRINLPGLPLVSKKKCGSTT